MGMSLTIKPPGPWEIPYLGYGLVRHVDETLGSSVLYFPLADLVSTKYIISTCPGEWMQACCVAS
jgi:hypothetical protein